jgi:RNA polymerase sigma-54 factor
MNGVSLKATQKQSMSLSLKLWLPILQTPLEDLERLFNEYSYSNPFIKCSSNNIKSNSIDGGFDKSEFIENFLHAKDSLFDVLSEQIIPPLFPTPKSQAIAKEIIYNIDENGYFDGNISAIAQKYNVYVEFVESIRLRFAHLEPYGVGAISLEEAFLFQLERMELDEESYRLAKNIIISLKSVNRYKAHPKFDYVKSVISKFNNPPAIEYIVDEPAIIPDFYIDVENDINIKINNRFYPDIEIKDTAIANSDDLKDKLKEARNLVSLLELRKSTLYKTILVIVQKQLAFFVGSELKPLTMHEVADELGFEESTISRVVSNKYIECKRGVFPLKFFFTNAIKGNISSSEVKNFIVNIIDQEDKESPVTDQDLVDMIAKRYNIKIVRRTVTKYRKQLQILSSKERKKFYLNK